MGEIAEYLESLPDEASQEAIRHVYEVARAEVPEATEGRSYGMAALIHRGKPLIAATASKNHLSIHPFSPASVEAVAADLDGFSLSKGTIRFTPGSPVPDAILARLVAHRRDEIEGSRR